MVAYRILFLAGAVAALPLNINLGAYSPALVVGDGEISFGGNNDVNGLMSVLQGAAVSAANGAAANGAATQGAAAAAPRPEGQPAAAPAAAPATPPAGAVSGEQNQVTDQAQQISALQGMGRVVLPRQLEEEEEEEEAAVTSNVEEEKKRKKKRDLASFDRALKFAEAALVKGPKVQLGTGEGGSGVGIIVDNNPAAAAVVTTGKKAKKRDLPATGRVKVTTMYVRSGIPSSLQNDNTVRARSVVEEAEDGVEPRYETIQIAPARREASPSPNAVDAVNLNVSGDQGVTMTFVETIDDEDDDE